MGTVPGVLVAQGGRGGWPRLNKGRAPGAEVKEVQSSDRICPGLSKDQEIAVF